MVNDTKPINAKLAIALGEVFNLPAERFLELQKNYDLAIARLKARPDPAREKRAHLLGELPVVEMGKRGWIDVQDIRKLRKIDRELARFFGVQSVNEIEVLPYAAKKTEFATPVTPPQVAWLYRVRQIAEEMIVPRYSGRAVRRAIEKLKSLLNAAEEARKVPRILAECGIRFVIVETLPKTKIDGVCFWLDEKSPVIGMSMRYDRIDNFWFVLRHELEHVVQLHGQSAVMLDVELERERAGTDPSIMKEERVANEAAADFCVPARKLESLIARKSPLFAERDILGFAKTLQIHPGLVAGQLQHQTGRYDRFRQFQVKMRHIVAPNAPVDGWGDIYPVGE